MTVEQANYLLSEVNAIKIVLSLLLGVALAMVFFMALPR